MMYKFKIGDKVYKPKGYKFLGIVVSVFRTTSGEIRIVAEMISTSILHIFSETQLELIDSNKKINPILDIILSFENETGIAFKDIIDEEDKILLKEKFNL